MLLRQGTDPETAEEIAQETMLAVWAKSHQFSRDRGSLASWIYGIARNLRIDRVRREAVWQRYHQSETARPQMVASDLVWEQHRGDVEHALGRLPPEQLEVIQLSLVNGLSQTEIAAQLALPLGTVKSRMRLAFYKLRCGGDRG